MTKRMTYLAVPMLASALALAACGETAETTEPADAEMTETVEANTVVDVAKGNPDFSTLVAAVEAAQLGETLSGTGPFTVFAPNNAAFEKLPAGTVDGLLKPESQAQLTGLLTYHVVAGKTDAAALAKAIADSDGKAELTTVNGGKLTASMEGENVILTDGEGNTSTVTATDVEASNGVIHVIDTVVMPAAAE
jgi:uncharacterized surface protein with fasciclin (FAS1) repeats